MATAVRVAVKMLRQIQYHIFRNNLASAAAVVAGAAVVPFVAPGVAGAVVASDSSLSSNSPLTCYW